MTKEIKNKTVEVKTSTVRVVKNFTRLVEAVCLLAVAGFALYSAYHYKLSSLSKYGLLFAGLVIALRGAVEFLNHLNNKE